MTIEEYIVTAGGFDDATNWECEPLEALRKQVAAIMKGGIIRDVWSAARYMANGGCWAVYLDDARETLRNVFGIKEEFDDDSIMWNVYTGAVASAVERMLKQ